MRGAAVGVVAAALLAGPAGIAGADASPASAPTPLLSFGASGPAVAGLQQDLLGLGYRVTGPADGVFGGPTWEGVVFFQRDHGLYPGGDVTPATWSALRAAAGAEPIGSVPLVEWDTGSAVASLQGDLRQFSDSPGAVDGNFGPQTLAALEAFQQAHGLTPSGVLDAATFAAVLAALSLAAYSPPAPQPALGAGLQAGAPASLTAAGPAGQGPQILAYWAVWGSAATALASLQANAAAIRWLSPYWYTLEPSGALQSRETDHAQVLAAAAGDRVLALINDGAGLDGLLSSTAGRQRAVAAVSALLSSTPGLNGVMIDFEQLPATAGAELTGFVTALRADLPAADTVGVAVGPETESNEPGEGLYNYAALGRVADLVQVMTYDFHDDGSAAGPIAPTSWVQGVADYAASVIPPAKILLGVPAYGYDWTSAGSAVSLTVPQAEALAAAHGVSPQLDASAGEDYFQYLDSSGRQHTVWFEAAAGVSAKRQIAASLGLGGLAVWTIGGESPDFWPALEGH